MNSRQLNYLLGAVALIALAALAYGAWGNKTQDQPISDQNTIVNTNTVTNNTNKSANTNRTSDITSNWKTFTNTEGLKFSFQYPSSWTVSTRTDNFGQKSVNLDSGSQRIGNIGVNWNLKDPPDFSSCPTGSSSEQVQLKDSVVNMCYNAGSNQEPPSYEYSSAQGTVKFAIYASFYPGEQNRNTLLQIFSTFKFTK